MICLTAEPSRPREMLAQVPPAFAADEDLACCRRRSARCRHRRSCPGCRGPRGHGIGAPKASAKLVLPGLPKSRGRADVEPGLALVRGLEDVAGGRADEQVVAVDRVDDEAGDLVTGHCGSTLPKVLPGSRIFGAIGSPLLAWSSPKVRPTPLTLTKLVYSPPWPGDQYWKRVPLPCWSTAVPEALSTVAAGLEVAGSDCEIAVGDQAGSEACPPMFWAPP